MRCIGVVLILTLFLLLMVNTGATLFRCLKAVFTGLSPRMFGAAFGLAVALILALFILSRLPDSPVPKALLRFGHYGLGVFVYALLYVNIAALLLFLGRAVGLIPTPQPAPVSLAALGICLALTLGCSVWGIVQANTVRTVRYDIAVEKPTEPIKIALISDLHIGHIVGADHLQKVVTEISRMEPDVVCIAGDIFDGDITAISDPEGIKAQFRALDVPVYACLGNHDAGASYPQMLEFLADAGVRVLLDEAVVVDDRLILVGRRDASPIGGHGEDRTDVELPEYSGLPVVVLDHQPSNIAEYGENVDLILCGHTHRGQLFPGNLVTGWLYDVDYGYYRASDAAPQVIVSSGIGTWGPVLRVGTCNEVVEIDLDR